MKCKVGKCLKKMVKWLAIALAVLVVILLLCPLWLGPVARVAAEKIVPGHTQTEFTLDHFSVNPYSGRVEIGDLRLGNPAGYDEPTALAISNLTVDAAMTTLGDKYVHIEEITLDGLFVSYVIGGEHKVDNFTQIRYNCAGGKEAHETAAEAARAAKEAEEAEADRLAAEERARLDAMTAEERARYEEAERLRREEAAAAAKKFVIDRLTIRNLKVKILAFTIPLPSLELKDLGKQTDGVTLSELVDQVWQAILKAASSVGDGAWALGEFASANVGAAASAVSEHAGKAASVVGEHAGKAASVVGEHAGKAADAIGEGAGKAASAVGEGVGAAASAVGEGAGKAADAVMNLFK